MKSIIELAREAGLKVGTNISGVTLFGSPSEIGLAHIDIDEMERFFHLIRAEVLEEAAGVCDTLGVHPALNVYNGGPDWYKHGKQCAAAIRQLKDKT